jgi:hypothetical protein
MGLGIIQSVQHSVRSMVLISHLLLAMWEHLALLGFSQNVTGMVRGLVCSTKGLLWMLSIQPCTTRKQTWCLPGAYPVKWLILSAVMLNSQFIGNWFRQYHNDNSRIVENDRNHALFRTLSAY